MGSGVQLAVNHNVQCHLLGIPCHILHTGLEVCDSDGRRWALLVKAANFFSFVDTASTSKLAFAVMPLPDQLKALQAVHQRLLLPSHLHLHSLAGGSALPQITTISKCL